MQRLDSWAKPNGVSDGESGLAVKGGNVGAKSRVGITSDSGSCGFDSRPVHFHRGEK